MKKKVVGFLIVAALVIVLSGCNFNLFKALDTIKVPSANDLLKNASSDAKEFVSDVQDYVDSGAITEDNADGVVDALKDVYTNPPDTETGQKAAVLAGEISITAHPETKLVVDNVIGTITDTINAGGDVDPQTLIQNIFPKDLTQTDLTGILDNLTAAADAYNSFGSNTAGAKDWMSGGDIGDVAQYAAVSMAVASIRSQLIASEGTQAAADADLFNVINGGTLPAVNNPFNSANTGTDYVDSLTNILNLAGLDI